MVKKFPLVFIVIVFVAFFYAKVSLYLPVGEALKVWEHEDGSQKNTVTLPYYMVLKKSGIHQFNYELGPLKDDYFVLPQLYGYAYKLFYNGVYIGGIGDFENPTANLWTLAQSYDLSQHSSQSSNRIQLEVYGLHDVGLNAIPYLTDKRTAIMRVTAINLINHDLTNLFIGISLGFSLLFFFLTLKMNQRKSIYLSYGVSLLLFSFYSLEFTFRGTSGTIENFMWLRKLLLISIYGSGFFLLLAQRSYLLKAKTPVLVAVIYNMPLVVMISAQDFVGVMKAQSILNSISIATIVYIAIIGVRYRYKATLIPNAILALTVVQTVLNQYFGLMQPYMLHLGVMVFLLGVSTIIVMDFQFIENENKKLGNISKKDPLTQAFNRSVLDTLDCNAEDCFAFIDLDRFKTYNDTYGHQRGDQLLKDIVNVFNHNMRKSDCVIRYGGDEFILFFKSCSVETVEVIIIRIKEAVQTLESNSVDISYGICPYQTSVALTIMQADHHMYEMKNKKKDL